MKKKILILGSSGLGVTAMLEQKIKEVHGDQVDIYTQERAEKENIDPEEFENLPTMKITATPKLNNINPIFYPERPTRGKGQRARNKSKNRNKWKR